MEVDGIGVSAAERSRKSPRSIIRGLEPIDALLGMSSAVLTTLIMSWYEGKLSSPRGEGAGAP